LELGKEKIVVIEKIDESHQVLDYETNTVTKLDLNMHYSMSYKGSTFITEN